MSKNIFLWFIIISFCCCCFSSSCLNGIYFSPKKTERRKWWYRVCLSLSQKFDCMGFACFFFVLFRVYGTINSFLSSIGIKFREGERKKERWQFNISCFGIKIKVENNLFHLWFISNTHTTFLCVLRILNFNLRAVWGERQFFEWFVQWISFEINL